MKQNTTCAMKPHATTTTHFSHFLLIALTVLSTSLDRLADAQETASPDRPRPATTPTPAAAATKPTPAAKPSPTPAAVSTKFPKVVTRLMVDDLFVGRGRSAKPGQELVIHFQAWLYDPTQPLGRGPQFESTQGKEPMRFKLQDPEAPLIKGWELGLVDMKLGGRRRLIIPPEFGYGDRGAGQVIPPNATLIFEIELVEIN